jgi:hypothetical protein
VGRNASPKSSPEDAVMPLEANFTGPSTGGKIRGLNHSRTTMGTARRSTTSRSKLRLQIARMPRGIAVNRLYTGTAPSASSGAHGRCAARRSPWSTCSASARLPALANSAEHDPAAPRPRRAEKITCHPDELRRRRRSAQQDPKDQPELEKGWVSRTRMFRSRARTRTWVPAWRRHDGAAGPTSPSCCWPGRSSQDLVDGEAPRRPTTIAITSAMSSAVTSISL